LINLLARVVSGTENAHVRVIAENGDTAAAAWTAASLTVQRDYKVGA
jgi:hypothetical protein